MNSLETTYVLACLHLVLCLVAFLWTKYPIISIFHLAMATAAICFGIRPILSATEGGYTFLRVASWSSYNRGLLYQLEFDFAYVLGYLLYFRQHRPGLRLRPHLALRIGHLALVAVVALATITAIHLLSGGDWLPGHRKQALTMLLPGGQILFRLAVTTLSAILPLAALFFFGRRRPRTFIPAVLGLMAVFFLTLLYQRGFVLIGFLLIAWIAERYRGITYRGAVALAALLVAALMILRPLASYIASSGETALSSEQHPISESTGGVLVLKKAFLFTGNFSLAETWPVAESFVESSGRLDGATLATIPLGLAPISFRWHTGLTTIVDRLNRFYYGDAVLITQWGFNANLAQNLFVNFGPGLLFLGCVPGALISIFDRWLREVKAMNVLTVFLAGATLASEGLVGDTAILLSYMCAYALVGSGLYLLTKVRPRSAPMGGAHSSLRPRIAIGSATDPKSSYLRTSQ
jgi:hypothetical protein